MGPARIVLLAVLLLVVLACARGKESSIRRSNAYPMGRDTLPRDLDYGAETEETLYGKDRLTRTRARMAHAQNRLLLYCEAHGRYPDTLAQALPTRRSEWTIIYDFDGWDQPLVYTRSDGEYTLRSAGPDRQLYTQDDVIGTSSTRQVARRPVPSVPQSNPCV